MALHCGCVSKGIDDEPNTPGWLKRLITLRENEGAKTAVPSVNGLPGELIRPTLEGISGEFAWSHLGVRS